MNKYYSPVPDDSGRYSLFGVVNYNLAGFDAASLWAGERVLHDLPSELCLYVDDANPPDYVANPLSWLVCSDKLAELIHARAAGGIQIMEAPLWRESTKTRVAGYKIVNVVHRIRCLSLKNSATSYRDGMSKELASVDPPVLDSSLIGPSDHLFRSMEFFPLVFFSSELFADLYEARVKGLAFVECDSI